MHLNPDELVDIVEGTRTEASAPHLQSCDACRRQLSELRSIMAVVAEIEVPEPSPLFWEQLSQRVHNAVGAEPARRGRNWRFLAATRFRMPLAAVAVTALLLIAVATTRLLAPLPPPAPSSAVVAPPREPLAESSDPSLDLVADLAAGMDWDTANEAGLAARGSADHAVTHLTDGELRELRRLLQEQLVNTVS